MTIDIVMLACIGFLHKRIYFIHFVINWKISNFFSSLKADFFIFDLDLAKDYSKLSSSKTSSYISSQLSFLSLSPKDYRIDSLISSFCTNHRLFLLAHFLDFRILGQSRNTCIHQQQPGFLQIVVGFECKTNMLFLWSTFQHTTAVCLKTWNIAHQFTRFIDCK